MENLYSLQLACSSTAAHMKHSAKGGIFGLQRVIVIAIILFSLVASSEVSAQLSGNLSIPGNYATITAAVADLNSQGVGAGGVTFNIAAGYTETLTGVISVTATGTQEDPIIFQKSGVGANPLLTAYTGGTATHTTTAAPHDGLFRLVGSDYVTIDGIDLQENPANTGAARMEYGYALLKASGTNGCQNNTIQNCSITLDKANSTTGTVVEADNGATGIWVANTLATGNAAVTVTDVAGANSYNKFYTNTIQNCNTGIYLRGFIHATPWTFYDQGNDVGGTSNGTGNIISNFGGGGVAVAAHAIRAIYQNDFNFSFNSINSNDGGGVNHTSTLRGIFMSTGSSSSGTINNNVVTLHGGGTTSALTAIESSAGSSPLSNNTISINNNIVENSTYTTATSGVFEGIVNGGSPTILDIDNNSLTNNILPGTGSMTLINGAGSTVSTNLTISNNTVSNNAKTGASGSMFCIRAGTATLVMTGNLVHDNSFTANSGTSASILYGLYDLSSPTSETYANNQIFNLSIAGSSTSTGHILYGIHTNTSSSSTKVYAGNTISNLQFTNSSTGSASVIGISHTLGTLITINNNKIYDLIASNGAASVVYGMALGSGTTFDVYNNYIGSLTNSAASAADAIRGIGMTTTSTSANLNISYNTIYINATSSGTNFGTSGIFHTTSTTATTATLNLRNNIIVNTSTPNGTGVTAAYRRSSTTLTNFGATSNNNIFYGGSPGANRAIFFDGTNQDINLADYKTRVAPRDAGSYTENPPFLSTTGSNANFLHINPASATQVESGAVNITGITVDFDNDIRQGNPGYAGSGSAPDVGADEGNFTGADFLPPTITYTPLTFTCSTGNRSLNGVTIADASGIPTAGVTQPRIYYKKNPGGAWFSSQGTLASGNAMNGTWNFTIVVADMGGVLATDVIYYYVIAQDIAVPHNITSNPSAGLVATNVNTVTTPPTTPNNYAISNSLSGTYLVGTGQSFTTLTSAINTYNTSCLTGAVVFELTDPSYAGETFPIVVNGNPDASATNTLTIRPAAGIAVLVSGSGVPLLDLSGADYVTLNGVNTGGSSMTFRNTSTSGATIRLIGDASNNTIQNMNIEGAVTTTSLGVVMLSTGTTTGNDNNTISNNVIRDRSDAAGVPANLIYSNGSSSTITNTSNTISGNTLKNWTGTAILITGTGTSNGNENWSVTANTIFQEAARTTALTGLSFSALGTNMISQNTIRDLTTSSSTTGITLIDARNTTVSRNWIYNFPSTSGSTGVLTGIQSSGSSGNPVSVTLHNNMVSIVPGFTNAQIIRGMYDNGFSGSTFTAFYNSVLIGGTSSGTSSSWAITRGIIAPTDYTAKNNIFLNTRTGGTGNHFGGGDESANTGTFVSDYNIFAGTGATLANFMDYGTSSTGTAVSAATWQAGPPARDANSQFGNPAGSFSQAAIYMSQTDLHAVLSGNIASNSATPVAIVTDFDNEMRHATTPDVGADEFTPPAGIDMAATGLATPMQNACYTNAETVTVTIENFSIATINFAVNNVTVSATATGPVAYASNIVLNSGSLASGATMNVVLPATIDMTANGTYSFTLSTSVAGDINTSNDMSMANRNNASLGGTYDVGLGGDFATLTAAVNAYNNATCLLGTVIFELTDANYTVNETFPIVINDNPVAGTNALIIRPASGVAANISGTSGTSAVALIKLNGADYVTIDGVNTGGASLTIENTSVSSGTAAVWIASVAAGAGATNNTIANTTIRAGVGQNASTTVTYGIVIGGPTLATTVTSIAAGEDNDNNTIIGNTVLKSRYAVVSRGGSSTNPNIGTIVTDNIIGPAAFGVDQVGKVGILIREEQGTQVLRNEVRYVGGNYANISSGTDRIGIALATDGTWTPSSVFVKDAIIMDNIIHDIVDERTFSAIGIGVAAVDGSNPTNILIANNMLYNIKANGTGSDQAVAIGLTVSNTDRVVFNTIYMTGDTDPDATAAAPTVSSFGISISAASTVTNPLIKDNIVFMDLTSSNAGTLKNACINIPASYSWGTGSSNFNDLFADVANPQSNTGCVGGSGGTFHLSLGDWQTAVTQDANSLDIMPVFLSPTNLHLIPASNVGLNDFGSPVAGVTVDIDGDIRDVGDPDMGADEFSPVSGLDVGVSALLEPVESGCHTSSETVRVVLTNYSITPLDFSLDNVTVTVTATGGYNSNILLNSGTLAGGTNMNVTLPATINLSTNGTYTFNASSSLSGDITPANDAMPPVNINISSLGGTYSVGTGQSGSGGFETITAAVNAFNNAGCITSPVVFQLTDASYTTPAESFPITVNVNPGAGVHTLTIKPAASATVSISGSATAIFKINGADNVIIDGSNNATTSRDLTISNTSTATTTAAVWIASLGTGAGSNNLIIKNTKILAGSNTVTSTFGIFAAGTSISTSGTGADNDNLVIENNEISKAYYAIYAAGTSAGQNDNLQILNNKIGSDTPSDYITWRGLSASQASGALISGNRVFNLIHTATNIRAMEFGAGFVNSVIQKNIISEINYAETSFSGGKGITLASGGSANLTVVNNSISGLKGHGSSTATNNTWAIMMTDGSDYNIYYNSINISDNRISTSSADIQGGIYIASGLTGVALGNNSISITGNPGNASGAMYGIYSLAVAPFTTSDFNDLYITGPQHHVGFISSAAQTTLANWQTASTQDASSIFADPLYNAPQNLTPLPGSPLVAEGSPVPGITTDILGVTRHLTTPTIGAYETAADVTGPSVTYIPLPNTLCVTSASLSAGISDAAGVNITPGTKPRLYFKKSTDANNYAGNTNANNGWKYVEATNAASPFSFVFDYSLLQSAVVAGDIIQYFVVAQDLSPSNAVSINSGAFAAPPSSVALTVSAFPISGTIRSFTVVAGGLNADVTIGTGGTYPTLTGAGGLFEAINSSGLRANIVATILDAAIAETGTNALNGMLFGCDGPFTLTIKPAPGVTTVLSGSSTTGLITLNGADNVTFDGSNNGSSSKDMTIRNTSTGTTANSFRLINDANSNVFRNMIIEGANSSTTNGVILFSTSGGVTGNSDNLFTNCFVRDRSDAAGIPNNGFYSSGTAGSANANNTITGCNIFNFNSSGINLSATGLGDNWTVSNNNIYNAQSTASAITQNGIAMASGAGHMITGNFIGGNAAGATGSWTNTGNVVVQGISLTGAVATVSGNTIANLTANNTGTTTRVRGIASTTNLPNVAVTNNTIHDLYSSGAAVGLAAGSANVMGVYFFPTDYQVVTVTGNVIYNISIENMTALTTSNVAAGMVLTNVGGAIANNTVREIKNKSTGTTAGQPPIAAGLYVRFLQNGFVANNMISIGSTETTNTQFNGIMITGGLGGQQFYYYNSVLVSGTASGAISSHAFLRGDNTSVSVGHPVNVRDNIFTMQRSGGGSINYTIASQGTNADSLWVSNYNDLHHTTPANTGYWFSTAYDLTGWQTNTGHDLNSVAVLPNFVSTTNLHLDPANNPSLENLGTPIAAVTVDFDLETRSLTTPDMGADEFSAGCPTIVTNTLDSGSGSLRDIVACAAPGATITFHPSLAGQPVVLTSGQIAITKNLTIEGLGTVGTVVSGNNASRIFELFTGNTLTLRDLSLINGSAVTDGGAILVQGNLFLQDVDLDNNLQNGVPRGLTVLSPGIVTVMGKVNVKD